MKNQIFSTISAKEFTNVVGEGRKELKTTFSSPFAIVNLLNKVAKGDMSKVKDCEGLTYENIKNVSKFVKALHAGRYAFDCVIFPKDSKGRFCTIAKTKKMPKFGVDLVDVNVEGFQYYQPIALNVTAFYNAFAKAAKVEIKAAEKAKKEEEKAAEKAAKALLSEEEKAARKAKKAKEKKEEKAYKDLCSKFYKGEICAEEFMAKAAKFKKAA